jgi:hypothetical protein
VTERRFSGRWALRSFEQQPTNKAFLKLLPLFRQSNIAHLLGFKLQYFQDAEVVKAGTKAPASLYQLAATLVASGWVALDALYPHLAPEDHVAFKARKESIDRRLEVRVYVCMCVPRLTPC